jgi:hypothetical protein
MRSEQALDPNDRTPAQIDLSPRTAVVNPAAPHRFRRLTNNCRGRVVCVRELAGLGNARLLPHVKTAEAPYSKLFRPRLIGSVD